MDFSMLVYFLIFFYLTLMACTQRQSASGAFTNMQIWSPVDLFTFIALILLIGFRYEVGADWFTYLELLDQQRNVDFFDLLSHGDPAYELLNWFGANIFGEIYFVNVVCACLFVYGIFVFSKSQPMPWLVLTIAFPYLIVVVAMGYTRQGVAIGLLLLGLVALMKGSLFRFLVWVTFAALFHKTVLVVIPIAVLSVSKRPVITAIGVIVAGAFLFFMLLQEALDSLTAAYIDSSEYSSSGAGFRVLLNLIPAFLFLVLRDRFRLSDNTRSLWTWMAVFGMLFPIFLYASPSSTAVDRIGLYLMPLQLFVLARLPVVFVGGFHRNTLWKLVLAGYSGVQLLTWIFFAHHSSYWVPYRFYPLIEII
jgi:hypothetical protein